MKDVVIRQQMQWICLWIEIEPIFSVQKADLNEEKVRSIIYRLYYIIFTIKIFTKCRTIVLLNS